MRAAGERARVEVSGVTFEMIWCPPGPFWMGSEAEVGYDDERPRHQVEISRGFWMGRTPVTLGLWAVVMGSKTSDFTGKGDSATRPVEQVSWYDSLRFCNRLSTLKGLKAAYEIGEEEASTVRRIEGADGFMLPTEAEWEYSAKAGGEQVYAGSDALDAVACYAGNSGGKTRPVGEKRGNDFGLYDMSGNVWEWVFDEWDSVAYSKRSGLVTDPLNTGRGVDARVCRGGSWLTGADACRVACRSSIRPDRRREGLGLRLLRRS